MTLLQALRKPIATRKLHQTTYAKGAKPGLRSWHGFTDHEMMLLSEELLEGIPAVRGFRYWKCDNQARFPEEFKRYAEGVAELAKQREAVVHGRSSRFNPTYSMEEIDKQERALAASLGYYIHRKPTVALTTSERGFRLLEAWAKRKPFEPFFHGYARPDDLTEIVARNVRAQMFEDEIAKQKAVDTELQQIVRAHWHMRKWFIKSMVQTNAV